MLPPGRQRNVVTTLSRKPKRRSPMPQPAKRSGTWGFTLVGWLTAACALASTYEWINDLIRSAHLIYIRGGPSRVVTLADQPGLYWISMAGSMVFVGFLLFISYLCFWAARACRG